MDLVILAAGEGKRFGGNKLLADIDGLKLYEYMEKIYESAYNFENKVIVSGDSDILKYYKSKGFIDIINNKPELGKSAYAVSDVRKDLGIRVYFRPTGLMNYFP